MNHHSPRGLTLIELMAAVAVAAILMAVAVPSFTQAIAKARLEGAVSEMTIDLQYARTQAIRRRSSATLAIDAAGTGYTLAYANPATGANVIFKTVTLPSGVIATANTSLQFTSLRGLAAAQTIDIGGVRTNATLRVRTNATGRVQTCTPSGSFRGYPIC